MKASLVIISFFAAGLFLGWLDIIPQTLIRSNLSFYLLCLLMFSVGIGIGRDNKFLRQFRNLSPRLLTLPLATVAGTYFGVVFVGLFFKNNSLTELLAIGSGFGYYSLSSILITERFGIELGTLALLTNIIREIITLLAAPWMVKYFGRLAPISAGGATSIDTTLPVILRNSGEEYLVVSIYHGFVMDLSVPFLVTLFCTI